MQNFDKTLRSIYTVHTMYICFESLLFDHKTGTAIWNSVSQSKMTTAVDVKCNSALYMSHNLFIIRIYTIRVPTNVYELIDVSLSKQWSPTCFGQPLGQVQGGKTQRFEKLKVKKWNHNKYPNESIDVNFHIFGLFLLFYEIHCILLMYLTFVF